MGVSRWIRELDFAVKVSMESDCGVRSLSLVARIDNCQCNSNEPQSEVRPVGRAPQMKRAAVRILIGNLSATSQDVGRGWSGDEN